MGTTEQVSEVIAPHVAGLDLELYDVELAGATLRVLVDRPGGVDLELLGKLTHELSAALDESDPLPGGYTLEVSSPGLERPLRTPRHFAAAVGSKVKVKTTPEHEGDRRLEGTLVAADDEAATVEVEGGEHRVPYGEVERARTVFEWGPAPKPASPGKSRKRKASR